MRRIFSILICLALLGSACNSPEKTGEGTGTTVDSPEPKESQEKQESPLSQKVPDPSPWMDLSLYASEEAEIGVGEISDLARRIEQASENYNRRNQTCEFFVGPGMITAYSYQEAIKKIRLDWFVESAHSHMEYFYESGKLVLIYLLNKEFKKKEDAKFAWLGQPTSAPPTSITEGVYYIADTTVKGILSRIGESSLEGAGVNQAEITAADQESFQKSIINDAVNVLKFARGEMTCEQLMNTGFYP